MSKQVSQHIKTIVVVGTLAVMSSIALAAPHGVSIKTNQVEWHHILLPDGVPDPIIQANGGGQCTLQRQYCVAWGTNGVPVRRAVVHNAAGGAQYVQNDAALLACPPGLPEALWPVGATVFETVSFAAAPVRCGFHDPDGAGPQPAVSILHPLVLSDRVVAIRHVYAPGAMPVVD